MKAPKFRPACECGAQAPRWTTSWTAEKWIRQHELTHEAQEDA